MTDMDPTEKTAEQDDIRRELDRVYGSPDDTHPDGMPGVVLDGHDHDDKGDATP